MKYAIVVVSILIFPMLAFASPPPPYTIWGIVTDEYGNKINGVNITIINNRTGDTLHNRSYRDLLMGDGAYIVNIGNFKNGWQDGDLLYVIAEKKGYKKVKASIVINASLGTQRLDIVLLPIKYNLEVKVEPEGAGYVILEPKNDSYEFGAIVNLQAKAYPGYEFYRWEGNVNASKPIIKIKMDSNKTIIAKFLPTKTNHPPNIEIIYPPNNVNVSNLITILGRAWDIDGDEIRKVEIKIDDGEWILANGKNNWKYAWNTTTVENGIHKIYARCYDGKNYSEVISVKVNVNNPIFNTPPHIQIIYPVNGSKVSGEIIIKGKAWDEDHNDYITKIEIKIDGMDWEKINVGNEWNYSWETKKLTNGIYRIYACCYDKYNNSAIDWIEVKVENKKETPGFIFYIILIAISAILIKIQLMKKGAIRWKTI